MTAHAWRAASGLVALALLAGTACGGAADTAPADGAADDATGAEGTGDGDPTEDAKRPADPDDPDEAADPVPDGSGDGPALRVSTPGFDGETIVVGALTPPPGSAGEEAATAAVAGIEAYVAQLNRSGGVLGRYPVEVRRVPVDGGAARDAYEATRGDVLLYVHVPQGMADALLEPFEADDVVGVPAATEGRWLREQNALTFLTPDEMQVANGIDWALTDAGLRIVTVDELRARWSSVLGTAATDPTARQGGARADHVVCAAVRRGHQGDAAAAAVRAVARGRALSLGTVAELPPGDPGRPAMRAALAEVVAELRWAGCETVVLASSPEQTGPLLAAAAGGWYAPRWVGLSRSWTPSLLRGPLAEYVRDHLVIVGNGLVDWAPEDARGAAAVLRNARDEHAPGTADGDLDFALGYAQALVAREVIERALAMGDMSRAGVINAINTLDELRLDGLAADVPYGPPEVRRTPRRSAIYAVHPSAPWGLRELRAPHASASTVVVAHELRLR
ncbi:MAG TPA: ABC transporter substrate-binding protein [Acidimicrobiales bacterium]